MSAAAPPGRPGAPPFDAPVPPDGYAWWYLDALDPRSGAGLTLIAFVGHVFSPAYAHARARGPADPLDFCALNVALHAPGARRWIMTEYARQDVARDADHLRLHATTLTWEGGALVIRLDARTAPFPAPVARPLARPVRGTIRLWPTAPTSGAPVPLTADGRHRWHPVAPVAHAEIRLTAPDLSFDGLAYHDANAGDAPLERDFARWDWARATATDGAGAPTWTRVVYDVVPREGAPRAFARRYHADGAESDPGPLEAAALPRAGWGLPRRTRAAGPTRVHRTLLAAPFYNRSWLTEASPGAPDLQVMHESFDGDRFARGWVRFLLPFRMRLPPRHLTLPAPGGGPRPERPHA